MSADRAPSWWVRPRPSFRCLGAATVNGHVPLDEMFAQLADPTLDPDVRASYWEGIRAWFVIKFGAFGLIKLDSLLRETSLEDGLAPVAVSAVDSLHVRCSPPNEERDGLPPLLLSQCVAAVHGDRSPPATRRLAA